MELKSIISKESKKNKKLIESIPSPIRDSEINHLRYIKTKNSIHKIYPGFCEHILKDYPGFNYVYLDRDARPIYLTMEIFKQEKKLNIENKIIAFTTKMLPKKLLDSLKEKRPYSLKSPFEETQERITRYVKKYRKNKTLLHDYLLQELKGSDPMLFIDSGFWGRCVGYLNAFFSKKKTDYLLMCGPSESNHFIEDVNEENYTNYLEGLIKHGFEIENLKKDGGKIIVSKRALDFQKNMHMADYIAIEIDALEHIYGSLSNKQILKICQ